MRGVVVGEKDLVSRDSEVGGDDSADPDFLAEGILDGRRKGPPRVRELAQGAGQNALELQHAAFVEDDGVEIRRGQAGVIQAPFDGSGRKGAVVLLSRQPFLLDGADRHAIDQQRRRRIVVMRGKA